MIEVKNLSISYKNIKAVDNVSFSVEEGEIFGMIGPNGAGKTSVIECIEGLRKPDSGTISVLGLNPQSDRKKLYELIGVQLQETSYPDKVKVWEICKLFSSSYKNPMPYEKLLQDFGLYEKRGEYVSKLSGGQKQKLTVILSLIPNPRIVFLDELTTGLDPQARRMMWDLIKGLNRNGITVFMTTHFMDEAEYLCNRIAIMNKGKIEALDTSENLVKAYGLEEKIIFSSNIDNLDVLKKVDEVKRVEKNQEEINVYGVGKNLLGNLVSCLQKEGYNYNDMRVVKPNLNDVFMKLTGYKIEN